MRNFLIGIILTLLIVLALKQCEAKNDVASIQENSALIQEQLKNVSKLIVTEGHFSQVFDYKKSKALLGNLFSADKKAIVVANADVSIAYDLSKIEYTLDEENKVLRITKIPEAEVKIAPDLEYYDLQQDFFNPFEAEDYNIIKETVKSQLLEKLEASDLRKNAKNRLISELAKFYILTNSHGWTLEYNENPINKLEDFKLQL